MKGRIIAASIVGVVIVLWAAWFLSTHDRVLVQEWVGPSGEARLREFLAAQRFAERMGLEVVEVRSLPELATLPAQGVLLIPLRRQQLPPARIAEILRDDRHPRIFVAREIARYHHARWDGEGYPEAVAGKRIPFAARVCAVAEDGSGPVDRTDATANAAGKPPADIGDHGDVIALSFGRVEIDQLHPGKPRELADPHLGIGRFDSELFALDQLNDPATLEVDRRNQHQFDGC